MRRIKEIQLSLLSVMTFFLLTSCEVKTEKISYGKDACSFCKMGIVDHQFSAEAVTEKGKIYKFDDVSCMVKFLKESTEPSTNYKFLVVSDYEGSDEFVDVKEAKFIHSESLRSPMRGDVAAFGKPHVAENFGHEDKSSVELTWEEVQGKF